MCSLKMNLEIIDWGHTEYEDAVNRQKLRVEKRLLKLCPDALIFTEHSPIYTMGLRKSSAQHLIWDKAKCASQGITIFESSRGGDITYHGPGQVVAYPIMSLRQKRDLHAYLRNLEEVVIRTLKTYDLKCIRLEGKTGIWVDGQRKISAIGVAVRSWICYHGFSLNVCPNMSHYDGIVPCGISDGTVTSIKSELKQIVDTTELKKRLAVEFKQVFGKN